MLKTLVHNQANYEYFVDSGILTFVNHGCNGTNNIGDGSSSHEKDSVYFNEATLDLSQIDEPPQGTSRASIFDPVSDRHLHSLATGYDSTSRDVKAGEELFQNYFYFISWAKGWKEEVLDLQAQCRGESLGKIEPWRRMKTAVMMTTTIAATTNTCDI